MANEVRVTIGALLLVWSILLVSYGSPSLGVFVTVIISFFFAACCIVPVFFPTSKVNYGYDPTGEIHRALSERSVCPERVSDSSIRGGMGTTA